MAETKHDDIGDLLGQLVAAVEHAVIGYNDGPARLLYAACNMDQLGSTYQKPRDVRVDVDRFIAGIAAFADPGTGRPVTCDDFFAYSAIVNALVVAAPLIARYNDALADTRAQEAGGYPSITFASCPIAWAKDRYMAHLSRCVDYGAPENSMYEDDDAYTGHLE